MFLFPNIGPWVLGPKKFFSICSRVIKCNINLGEELPQLLDRFEELMPTVSWHSRKQLLQTIYGYGLDDLHPDMCFEEQQMSRQAALVDHLAQGTIIPTSARDVTRNLKSKYVFDFS